MIQTMTTAPDGILEEYTRLSAMNVIDDPQAHAEEWRQLAIVAAVENRISTSMDCMARVLYWQNQVPCIRLVEGSFSELVPTEHKTDEIQGVYDWQVRVDIAGEPAEEMI